MEIVHQAKTEAEQIVRKLKQMQKEAVDVRPAGGAGSPDALSSRYSKHYDAWTQVSTRLPETSRLKPRRTYISNSGRKLISREKERVQSPGAGTAEVQTGRLGIYSAAESAGVCVDRPSAD